MKEPFADYKTSERLKELGFDDKVMGYHLNKVDGVYITAYERVEQHRSIKAPLWQEIKQWLWEKHGIAVSWRREDGDECFNYKLYGDVEINRSDEIFESPITAEIEGIKKAIEYLYNERIEEKQK